MTSEDEAFLDEVSWADVTVKREKVTYPPRTLRCTSDVFSPIQYIQRSLDEAARCSGGYDNEESKGVKIKKKDSVQ